MIKARDEQAQSMYYWSSLSRATRPSKETVIKKSIAAPITNSDCVEQMDREQDETTESSKIISQNVWGHYPSKYP